MKFRGWIIDDYQFELDRAQEVIKSVSQEMAVKIEPTFTQKFFWPLDEKKRPDFVILDLYNDTALDGMDIYECIRDEEKQLKQSGEGYRNFIGEKCYIILWSEFRGDPEATKYFEPRSYSDNRLVLCTVKSKVLLKNALIGCINRMQEEDI